MTAAWFEVYTHQATPEIVPGTEQFILDQYEWLQLTLGRFLAPARKVAGTRDIEYLVLGQPYAARSPELASAIDAETHAFERALDRLADSLAELIDSGVGIGWNLTRYHRRHRWDVGVIIIADQALIAVSLVGGF